MDLKAAKDHLRRSIQERIARMTPGEKAAEGRSVSRRIIESLPPAPAVIAAYVPMGSEVNISLLLEHLWKNGYEVYLPRGEKVGFSFRKATSFEELRKGVRFNVPEPPDDAEELDPKTLNLAIIPARAYNAKGERLGRGNGGYDIWITKQRALNPSTKFWGVAFDCQIIDEIPMEPHDAYIDAVVTPRSLIETSHKE